MATKRYRVADGVAWVNGRTVPENRIVSLTEAEALFDLAHGRITPTGARRPRTKRKTRSGAAEAPEVPRTSGTSRSAENTK